MTDKPYPSFLLEHGLPLTPQQHSLVVATLLADGHVELGKNDANPRLRFFASLDRVEYVEWWADQLKP